MKKLLILSGKGGTGKTTVAAALIEIFAAKAFADCDVDAPNLHLVQSFAEEPARSVFYGSQKAYIDAEKCTSCGACAAACRFGAIKLVGQKYIADEYSCEGCGVCEYVCPWQAVTLGDDEAGRLELYKTDRTFSTAQLKMGRGNSGKLVTAVKNQLAKNSDAELAVIDGSPGIGCPVVASISGADMVLIVAEPSQSGIADMERILDTVARFEVPAAVCVNKWDTSPQMTAEIELFCGRNGICFVGKIPFDSEAARSQNGGRSVIFADCPAAAAIREISENVGKFLESI